MYRLVTMSSIEEMIYRRQIYKKAMTLQTVEKDGDSSSKKSASDFEKYFNNNDLFELFKFDSKSCNQKCQTLDMLLEADGFPYEKTPTNERHISYLRSLTNEVKGISLNSNLYTQKEKKKAYESDED